MECKFDIKEDVRIVNEGGFFCEACLIGKPEVERSNRDIRYCKECRASIDKEQRGGARDYWTDGGMTFVHYGKGYRVTPQGKTVCVGEVKQ